MSLLSWNYRGLGSGGSLGSPTMNHLALLLAPTKAQVIFISETRNSSISRSQLINRFSVLDSFIVLAAGQSGGLWVMWNDNADLTFIHSSNNLVLAKAVYKPSSK